MPLRLSIPTPPPCAECGGEAIYHRSTYISIAIDELFRPLYVLGAKASSLLARVQSDTGGGLWPAVADMAVRARIAEYVDAPDEGTMLLAKVLWDEADARGIRMREFRLLGLPRNLFVADVGGKRIGFEGAPLPGARKRVWWMDDKATLKRKFAPSGIPVARGGAAQNIRAAQQIFSTLTPPVIVKPASGSGSRHTTLHITTAEELDRAFGIAKQVAPVIVIEEELIGSVYRATAVDGKFSAALRRDPPHVVGDGAHTIAELVEHANEHPARNGPYYSKLKLNDAAHEELAWQGMTAESVPEKGKRVYLHQKVNWGLGGTTEDVTDEVHPDNVALFERVARELRAPIVGIDFIIGDMSRSWKEQERCGVIECNSLPFFDNHHLPFSGKPRNVAGDIWDMALAHYAPARMSKG